MSRLTDTIFAFIQRIKHVNGSCRFY